MSWYLIATILGTVTRSVAVELSPPAPDAWWRHAVCYEVFVRSFYDSNGDGIGDLKGLTAKLDYINDGNPRSGRSLGANCIWLMPIAKSPSYHGYDVSDYYHVNPDYGSDADFRELVKAAHRRGIRVIVDFVPNHTSSQLPAFQAALRDTASPYRDWYRWSKVKPNQKGPWGQEVWHRSPVRDEYYYGLFWAGMPDLNYEKPAALREMEHVAAYWVREMGVDGFRIDAASHLVEEGSMMQNAEGTHRVLRQFSTALRRVAPAAFTIGEVWTDSASMLARYYPDQLDAYFAFALAEATLNAAESGSNTKFVNALEDAIRFFPAGRWSPLLTNHDQPRVMTRLRGDASKARVAAIAMLSLPGTPFVYYGEEIGMSGDKPDPQIRNPMQWSSRENGGFTTGHPWEALKADWATRNVEAENADPNSLINLYRTLIHLRLRHPALSSGTIDLLETGDTSVAAFVRKSHEESVLVVLNFSEKAIPVVNFSIGRTRQHLEPNPLFGDHVKVISSGGELQLRDLSPRQGYWFQLAPSK